MGQRPVVYTGGRDGLHIDTARILTGPPHSQFGCAVAGAGDVNGDGYTDVIVGSCDADRAFVFLGRTSGLSTAPAFTLPCDGNAPRYVAGLGDVNGDGFSDVIVGTLQSARSGAMSLYLGGPTALSRPLGITDPGVVSFGPPMMGLGDVNRDGFDDAIAGAAEASELFIYKGGATVGEDDSWAASTTLTGPPESGFGAAFGGAY